MNKNGEEVIYENFVKSSVYLNIEQIKNILQEMINGICCILIDNIAGTGFFAK